MKNNNKPNKLHKILHNNKNIKVMIHNNIQDIPTDLTKDIQDMNKNN